jgi:hypothetical protein
MLPNEDPAMILASQGQRDALFSSLLRSIRVRSSVFARPELSAPWGFSMANEEAAFHMVTCGQCTLSTPRIAIG